MSKNEKSFSRCTSPSNIGLIRFFPPSYLPIFTHIFCLFAERLNFLLGRRCYHISKLYFISKVMYAFYPSMLITLLRLSAVSAIPTPDTSVIPQVQTCTTSWNPGESNTQLLTGYCEYEGVNCDKGLSVMSTGFGEIGCSPRKRLIFPRRYSCIDLTRARARQRKWSTNAVLFAYSEVWESTSRPLPK